MKRFVERTKNIVSISVVVSSLHERRNRKMIDLIPSQVSRAFGSESSYSETLSNVHKFNARFLRERRFRLHLPFVDSQTHIIQSPTQNHLWRQAKQRLIPYREDQVIAYARPTWQKKRVHLPKPAAAAPSTEPMKDVEMKEIEQNGEKSISQEDDPRILIRAGELGRRSLHFI